jgi:hypothetical protein
MSEEERLPAPGSKEAIELGCTCACADNNHGEGVYIDGQLNFWQDEFCPLHGMRF